MTFDLRAALRDRLQKAGKLRKITPAELAAHSSPDDGWIAVQGAVYDITPHVQRHPGWKCGCAVSELMAILRTLGTDCTEEFLEVHSGRAWHQLQPFMIGELCGGGEAEGQSSREVPDGGRYWTEPNLSIDMETSDRGKPPSQLAKPKCCIGVLYFSSSRFDAEKAPVCTGLAKRLRPGEEAAQLPTDSIPGGEFKYLCAGYSAWDEEGLRAAARRRTSSADAVTLPYCEGLEVVSSAAVAGRPELLTDGPGGGGSRRGGGAPQGEGATSDAGPRPGRSFVPGLPGSLREPHMPGPGDWDQFRARFERMAGKIMDKMGQNATLVAAAAKKSWDQVVREVGGGGRDRPPGS